MKFSEDGRFLATAGRFCTVYVWEVATSSGEGEGQSQADRGSGTQSQSSAEPAGTSRQNSGHSPGCFILQRKLWVCLDIG